MVVVSSRVHTFIGLGLGIALVGGALTSSVSGWSIAVVTALFIGCYVLVSELTTTSFFSPIRLIPMRIHQLTDIIAGLFLIASPFIFQFFSVNEVAMWIGHIVVGIGIVLVSAVTSTADDIEPTIMSPGH